MKPKLTYALATLIFAVALKPLIKTSLGASLIGRGRISNEKRALRWRTYSREETHYPSR